jgi:hypothetical protein
MTMTHRWPRHGTWGLLILLLMQTAVWCAQTGAVPQVPWTVVTAWTTPVCWWGFILVVDAWIYRRKGTSLLTARRELLALQCILSVAFWCLFEAYNRLMPGWRYLNLEEWLPLRFVGYAVSFATIMPAMFLVAEWLQSHGVFATARLPALRWSERSLRIVMVMGVAACVLPPWFPPSISRYLWALVWVGWWLMLEPINYRRAMPSLFRDWERGDWSRTLQLATAGAVCGLLWEFWNMWAHTRWEYTFLPPDRAGYQYFEMPLVGFPGFLPFALDYFVMFHFLASFFTREDKLGL